MDKGGNESRKWNGRETKGRDGDEGEGIMDGKEKLRWMSPRVTRGRHRTHKIVKL